jgi:predicted outer membrane repeat protein
MDRSTARRRNSLYAALSAAIWLLAGFAGTARAIDPPNKYVGTSSNCTFHKLKDAIDNATSGWHIVVDGELDDQVGALITDKNLTIEPGHCPGNTGTLPYRVTIDGVNGSPVLVIKGSSQVHLVSLLITGGTSDVGAGINYSGHGTLTLTNVSVFGNTANYGGGINFRGDGNAARLILDHDTSISSNIANASGGGIRVEGTATLEMLATNTSIAFNEAHGSDSGGYGGGIEVIGPAKAYVGSPGGSLPALYHNTAVRGGGVAAVADSSNSNDADVFFFTTDPARPVTIRDNVATVAGGGIYLSPALVNQACLFNFRLDANIAKEGAALFANNGSSFGSTVRMNDPTYCPLTGYASVACGPNVACSTIHGNLAQDANNGFAPTHGATLLLQSGSTGTFNRVDVRGNHGDYVMRIYGNSGDFITDTTMKESLFAENTVVQQLILQASNYAHLSIDNCTFTHDSISAAQVMAINDTFHLKNSIVAEGALAALAFSGDTSNIDTMYDIADNTTGLVANPTVVAGSPIFVGPNRSDYRLLVTKAGSTYTRSLGVDFAPNAGDTDLLLRARDQDIAGATNFLGSRDLGAYEMQPINDRVFGDGMGDAIVVVY